MKLKNIKKNFIIIIIQLIFCGILSSCSSVDLKKIFPEILDDIDSQKVNNEIQPEEVYTPPVNFSLALFTGETLNPYTSQNRANHELMELCYDSLISLDNSYNAIPVIAEKYIVTENKITVYLKHDALFSDNTPVTAVDCLYSFQKASDDNSIYKTRFNYISDWSVVSDYVFEVDFF
jgi:ABC-type transport system substrate-binding protein